MPEKEALVSYVRVGILGQTTGGEVWSINPTFDPSGEFGSSVDQTALDAAATAIAALSPGTQLLARLSTLLQITGSRVEVRDDATDGLIAIANGVRGSALSGTGTVLMPPQCATVYSLRTNTPGASGRGRFYWPCLGAGITSTGRLAGGTLATDLTSMKAYMLAIRDALATAFPTIGFNLAVRSRLTKTTPHVVRMQVGDVIDTQRRRRDKFPEGYQTTPVP